MARISHHKARKEYICDKCHQPILKGTQYVQCMEFMRNPTRRHETCGYKPSETVSSEHLQNLYAAQEDIQAAIITRDPEQIVEAVDSAKSTADDESSSYQESADNKEEYFPGSSDEIQEKVEACDNWSSELDSALDELNACKDEYDEIPGPWDTEAEDAPTHRSQDEIIDEMIEKAEDANSSLEI